MSTATFDVVADIIAKVAEIDRPSITEDCNVLRDLEVDSIDMLDIVFDINKHFGIDLPIEEWSSNENMTRDELVEMFGMRRICAEIDRLVQAKAA